MTLLSISSLTKRFWVLALPALLVLGACNPTRNISGGDDGKITVTFLQMNDVYEIAPIEGGNVGGLARVATIKKQFLQQNKNTFLVMAGDFLSPSVYNSIKYEGERIRGKQMVESMNAAATDLVGFGNHEFDITLPELQSRINESAFQWVSSNSFLQESDLVRPFQKIINGGSKTDIPETFYLDVADDDGTTARLGIMGINITANKAPYVVYTDPLETAKKMYNRLKDSCDAVIAITHQLMKDDIELARACPGLAAIIGGHEHDMRYAKIGDVVISKAHANARSLYVVNVSINKKKHSSNTTASLMMVDTSVAIDPTADVVVQKWEKIANDNFALGGFNAKRVILQTGDSLMAKESVIRTEPTNFSRLVVKAMEAASPQASVAIVNTGSIRLDDILYPPITEYDIVRAMPFGGGIAEADMNGALLKQVLDAGVKNRGIGGYLAYSDAISWDGQAHQWKFKGVPITDTQTFRVALTDFLLTGAEQNLEMLTKNNPNISSVSPTPTSLSDPRSDIRLAIIRYLQQTKQ